MRRSCRRAWVSASRANELCRVGSSSAGAAAAVLLQELSLEERGRVGGERPVRQRREREPALDRLSARALHLEIEEAGRPAVEPRPALEALPPALQVMPVAHQPGGVEVDRVVLLQPLAVDLERQVIVPELSEQPLERLEVDDVLAVHPRLERGVALELRQRDRIEPVHEPHQIGGHRVPPRRKSPLGADRGGYPCPSCIDHSSRDL